MRDWLERLTDALGYMDWLSQVAADWPGVEEHGAPILAAARLVVDGQDVWWCTFHKCSASSKDRCWEAEVRRPFILPCRLVPARLVFP